MGTYRGIGEGNEPYEIHYNHEPTPMPSVSSIDAENGHNQFEMRYEVVGKQNRDSFDSLLLRPESPDRNKEVPSSAVDPQTPGTLRPSSTWQRGRRLWSYGWVAETVGFSVALISLMSILIVLLSYQNRQVDTWPLFITINAFIAVFTVLLKAGLALPLSEGWAYPVFIITLEVEKTDKVKRYQPVEVAMVSTEPTETYEHT